MKTPSIQVKIRNNRFTEAQKEAMWRIYTPYYCYAKEDFLERIPTNSHYAVFTCGEDIIGFSGLRIDRVNIAGSRRLLIYFGQVVIDEPFRGKSLMPIVAAKLCMKFWKDLLFSKLYFWADCLTYKAYLVFAKTIEECYPSRKYVMPAENREIIHFIGEKYYRDSYNYANGTVRKSRNLVSDPAAQIVLKHRQDEDIRFFTQANPLYAKGHGLITLAPMNYCNIRMLFGRYLQKFWRSLTGPKPVQTVKEITELSVE